MSTEIGPGANVPAAPPEVDQDALDDLAARLARFRRVPTVAGRSWERGVDPDFLTRLVEHWRSRYDWRLHERRIRAMPWVATTAAPYPTRAIQQRGPTAAGDVVVLLHGWPDSVLRFERLLPLLADVEVIVPALPGFPFAVPLAEGGLPAERIAEAVAALLSDLGHDRYVVSAGDVGCDVAEALAARHPDAVAALHLTDVSQYHFLHGDFTDLTAAENDYVRHGRHWQATEGGYMHEQSTRPSTLAAALGDSPAGLAAWIVEKLRGWTDRGDPAGAGPDGDDLGGVFSFDEVLTWISAYWFSGSIGTSFTPYALGGAKPWPRITTPTAFTIFSRDLVNAPREFADRLFDVRHWRECLRGGHFAAWERPQDYADGVRAALDLARR